MNTTDRIIHWVPRVISILAILFVSLFAFDVFSPELTVWQQILALLMHLIPSFILLGLLIVAWKWERVGGIILTVIGLVFLVLVFNLNHHRNQFPVKQSIINASIICLPFVLAGVLFVVSYYRKQKTRGDVTA